MRSSPTDQVANALGESRFRADELLGTAGHLDTHLPGTKAALRDGTVSLGKARLIATATGLLDATEARAAESGVLDRAARLTPGGLRAAIARAVMEAAPDKARKRRETAARFARVERWAEDSGNAALAGRELPPDQVLAVDDRITAWAGELKNAGLDGGMDEIRARAYLDLLLGKDSRPGQDQSGAAGQPGNTGPAPGGFAGRVTLTVPLATLTDFADRPGELAGLGPVDPWLARDLAGAAARNPETTWCVTVTDEKGHAVGHGCARPGPRNNTKRAGPGPPGYTFTPASRDGPPERARHLAAAHPRTRTRPDRDAGPPDHRPLRPPIPGQGSRSRGQAQAPVPGPARHLHQPDLPAARRPVRPRAQHPVRSGRPDLPV